MKISLNEWYFSFDKWQVVVKEERDVVYSTLFSLL